MKILIEIPESVYEHAMESSEDSIDESKAMSAIRKGVPITQPQPTVFDKIIDEIEQESFHDANGVIYCGFTRVCKIIEKYKGV